MVFHLQTLYCLLIMHWRKNIILLWASIPVELVPGMGAQGGRPSDLPRVLGPATNFAIPSYSRQIAQPGPAVASIRTAIEALQEECRAAMGE